MKKYTRAHTRSYFNIEGVDRQRLLEVNRWLAQVEESEDFETYTDEEQDIFRGLDQSISDLLDHLEWDEE